MKSNGLPGEETELTLIHNDRRCYSTAAAPEGSSLMRVQMRWRPRLPLLKSRQKRTFIMLTVCTKTPWLFSESLSALQT